MAKSNGKIALVAGASSGSGEATAERFAKAAYKVYGTSRRQAQAGVWPFAIWRLGVTNDDARSELVGRDGRIDVLVNKVTFAHDCARRSRHCCSHAAST
jgi:NADP-dependent 3-hydroxy acid dehydrogenase YdfG